MRRLHLGAGEKDCEELLMGFWELLFIGIGLSMDAFAVAVCKGLAFPNAGFREAAVVGLYFGAFQALMPLIGYYLGAGFSQQIAGVDHWIAFVLLLIIGGRMVWESLRGGEECQTASLRPSTMLVLAVATSIDAFAVGMTLAFLGAEVFSSVSLIGVTTFLLSVLGVMIGKICGSRFKKGAEIAGGIILILIGCKILIEHTGLLGG